MGKEEEKSKEETPEKAEQKSRELRGAAIALTVGYAVVAPIIGGPIIGWILDKQFGTSPWLFLILMVGGIYGGLSMAVRLAGKL
jgi:ATP synthase protein I